MPERKRIPRDYLKSVIDFFKQGLVESPEERTTRIIAEDREKERKVALAIRHALTDHSDATPDEIEFFLGTREKSPEPVRKIIFTECGHREFRNDIPFEMRPQ